MISYSAPAKVILSGEHAVVYGKPALVCAINQRLRFTVFERSSQNGNSKKNKTILIIADKIKNYLKEKKIKFIKKIFDYKIDSQIPIGQGLGSSAALSVAAVAAFLKFYSGKDFDKELINVLAYQIEKECFHKNPSGVDNTASCFGGLIYYRKEFEFLKNISLLSFKIPKKIEENLFLIDGGKPAETTAEMVETVGKIYNKKPSYVEDLLTEIEKNTKKMVLSIIKEDVSFFQKTIIDNEVYLEKLGVVSKTTKNFLSKLKKFGAGKITGAGGIRCGSGFILFFANDALKLRNYLDEKRISYFKFKEDHNGLIELQEK